MTLHRTRPLPRRPAVGKLLVPESVLTQTRTLLRAAGTRHAPHEGLVWWLGRHIDGDTIVLACHAPACTSGRQFVRADAAATGAAARAARALRLGVVAQVHSHPGSDTRHSDGDDDLILMPYEGMFSLVVANYGNRSLLPQEGAGLHQLQNGQWIQTDPTEPALLVIPAEVVHA
jgi:proteasome lid subunit RPN8/RPN11